MLKKKSYLILLFIILISSVAYSKAHKHHDKMYTEIMDKLNFEPRVDASEITISIKGDCDTVILGGVVKNHYEKTLAENLVKDIRGVKAVIDEINVNSLSWRKKRTDNEIVKAAINNFKWNALIPEEQIKIIVDDGHVTLFGEVDWQYQKNVAWSVINTLIGVKSIQNNIIIKPSTNIDISKVKKEIFEEFERHARIDASKIKIETKDGVITLKGMVANFDEKEIVENIAWSVPGVKEVRNELILDW